MVVGHVEFSMYSGNLDGVLQRLLQTNAFFVDIIDSIPPKVYFDQEIKEKLMADKHELMDKKAEALKKSASSKILTAKNKHKRARLDPKQHKTVSQVQQELEQEGKPISKKQKKGSVFSSATLSRAASIGELRERLQKRIQEEHRKSNPSKNLRKKRRLSLKIKDDKKKIRQKGNLQKNTNGNLSSICHSPKKPAAKFQPKPIYNKDGKLIYSKFDFSDTGANIGERFKKNEKNYKKLIETAELEAKKLEDLKSQDKDKANALLQKKAWQRALQKAEGIKLKDEPAILKKTLKRIEKKKNKSAKEWKARQEYTEKLMKDRQDRRMKNVRAKKKEKLDKKVKRARKKRRIIPGF